MRKTLFTLVVFALASPALAETVQCTGTESGGDGVVDPTCAPGPRMYAYPVTEADGKNLTDLYIGTDDCDPTKYSLQCQPAGWTFAIEPRTGDAREPHYSVKTPHGAYSAGPDGFCPCVVHWSDNGVGGGLPDGTFTFGFNNKEPSHDVGWQAIVNAATTDEDWTKMVGATTGLGPVHGPRTGVIPTVTGWGFAVMLLLIAAAGTVVIRRRTAVV